MNKNAFTLVELLAVITILGVILMIAVPSYNKQITKSRNKVYESYIEQLKDAASTCITRNDCIIVDDKIYMNKLKEKNYLSDFTDPKTKKSCTSSETTEDSYVKVEVGTIDGVSQYTYNVCLKCGGNEVDFSGNSC